MLAGVLTAPAATGQLRIQPEVEASLTVTDNAAYAASSEAQSDVILSVNPRVAISSRGGRASLEGTFGVEGIVYANTSDATTVRPRGNLDARSELVQRWVFLEASIAADRVSADPYAARPESASAFNDYTALRYRLSPYIERQLTPLVSFLARTDHVITRQVGSSSSFDPDGADPARDAHEQAQVMRLERRPVPFGWIGELTREDTRLRDESTSVLTETGARATATFAATPQLTVGAILGREKARYSVIEQTDSIVGGRIDWRPTERTTLEATVEERYFGTGFDIALRHRSPFLGVDVQLDRMPVAETGSQRLGFAGADVASLLDGVLTTRFPDEAQRRPLVDKLIRDLDLPATLVEPLDLYTSYAQLQDNASVTLLLFGRVTTATATAFVRRRLRLEGVEDVLAPAELSSDNRQVGVEVGFTRRLSPTLTADLGVRASEIEGLGERRGDATRDVAFRGGVTLIASPATRVGLGGRYQFIDSSVTTRSREMALVLTLLHRF